MATSISLSDVFAARDRIRGIASRTPLRRSISLSLEQKRNVYCKIESMQATGAFKLRGAANAVLALDAPRRKRGVVAASSGNHGRAIAYVAQQLGIDATVYLSTMVPESKINSIRCLGAKVVVGGNDQNAAITRARALAEQQNSTYICSFDDRNVIAGQATIGLEIIEDCPHLDAVIVQVSGGGLAAGVSMVVKTVSPRTRTIGVTMAAGASMYHSLQAGHPVEVQEESTLADGLQGGVLLDNQYTFAMCQKYLDDLMLISEEQIAEAMRYAFRNDHLVMEGAAACGLALLRDPRSTELGTTVATICTGDNIGADSFLDIVDGGL
ncbi:MAG TPA: pyridoxal-phosphate dependent enzyme [Woeseiaceae bacterium]|nr:pyridoxal-phosphate dependent enzyme [Woeseiaceae bacterium]